MTIQAVSNAQIHRQNFGSSNVIFNDGTGKLFMRGAGRLKNWLLQRKLNKLEPDTTYIGNIVVNRQKGRIAAHFETPDGNSIFMTNVEKGFHSWVGFIRKTFKEAIELDKREAEKFDLF